MTIVARAAAARMTRAYSAVVWPEAPLSGARWERGIESSPSLLYERSVTEGGEHDRRHREEQEGGQHQEYEGEEQADGHRAGPGHRPPTGPGPGGGGQPAERRPDRGPRPLRRRQECQQRPERWGVARLGVKDVGQRPA